MSTVVFIRKMLEAGFSHEDALRAAEAYEAAMSGAVEHHADDERTARQERNRRYYERRRLKASENRLNASEASYSDAAPAPPPSPSPRPLTLTTPTPPDVSTRTREASRREAFDVADGFAVWWLEYPNKVAKAAAQKAYAVACRKIGGPDPPAILLAGLRRAKSSDQWLRGFIPHPTTWLNQGRWDDQPAEITPSQSPMRRQDDQRPDPKRTAREANYARAFAGFEAVARSRS